MQLKLTSHAIVLITEITEVVLAFTLSSSSAEVTYHRAMY